MALMVGTEVGSIHDLAARAAGGDHDAFSRLYDLTAGAAWRVARVSCSSDRDAENVLRRVYRELWDRAGDAEVQADPRGWVLGTAHLAARGPRAR